MVHRREGTGTGKIFLQPNDDNSKNSHSHTQSNHDTNVLTSATDNCESLPQLFNDSINSTKSPAKSKTPSPNSKPSTPTRKGNRFSQEKSPKKAPSTPVKRSILRKETNLVSEAKDDDTSPSQNGNKKEIPKSLRSGLLRVSRLQSTSLIEAPNIARNRGRRKTICHSLEDINSVEPCKIFGKFNSAENLVEVVNALPIEKLTCSLPLAKLSIGVMQSILSSSAGKNVGLRNHSSDTDLSQDPASLTNDIVGLSSPQTAAKLLCLYCDKKFTSQKLLCKHTERVHATDGRRLSSRNSVASLSWPSIISYPGCWYCGNSGNKLTATTLATSVADDLKALFHHFLDVHSDKYYACKSCEVRFSNAESMAEHITKRHSKDGNSKTVESKTPSKIASKRLMTEENSSPEDLTQPLHVNVESAERTSPSEDIEPATYSGTSYPLKTRRQIKQQALQTKTSLVTRSCQNLLRNNEDTILTRLGVAQNRLPRGRKGTRNRRLVNAEIIKPEQSPNAVAKVRNKIGKIVTTVMKDLVEGPQIKTPLSARAEPLSCTFDDDFYETVSINVRQNLSCHLDGKLDGGPTSPSPTIPVPTVPAIRSTVVRSPLSIDSEIHEATALAAVTAFPTLLTAEQYGSDRNTERKIKRPITKHSWKWKWDCVKKYKYVNEGGKIVKKIKQPISGLRDLSKLDMWTQLTMRTKHELTRRLGDDSASVTDGLQLTEVAREEKLKQLAQLDSILDSRVFPRIVLEQTEQSFVKLEPECDIVDVETLDNSEVARVSRTPEEEQIPQLLRLNRCNPFYLQRRETLILSGEWARPRCYICFSCGGRFDILKTLEEHKVSRHPYIYSTHYEIVGRELIEGDLYKHLYIPVRALRGHLEYKQRIKEMKSELDHANGEEESMDSVNSLSASTTSANGNTTVTTLSTISSLEEHLMAAEAASVHIPRRCTKCKRMCNGKLELYRHMLNCFGDYAWRIAQKRKYRYFGVKSRRHARQNFQRLQRRKALAKKGEGDESTAGCSGKSVKCSTVRSRPSDAETIRRMLENLPPKRACRQIIPNITKPRCIKFAKNLGLKKLVSVGCSKKVKGKAVNVASTTLTAISSNMRRKQRLMARQITRRSGRMAMRLRELKQNSSKSKCEEVVKKSAWTNLQEKVLKPQPDSDRPQNEEKCLNEKKCNGNGKKARKVENCVSDESALDSPNNSAQSDKTPKKRTPVKRGQERSPKSSKEEESPSKISVKSASPKQSPNRDNPPNLQIVDASSISQPTNPREPLNLVVPSAQTSSPLLQVSPANKRQRGKKLTDCIAKLQEKLGKPFFEGNENLDTVLSARQQSPPQNQTTSNVPSTAAQVETSTRTPKRKTVTRKIIQKTNAPEEAFVAPKPALIAPAIKIESEEDSATAARSCSKEGNLSMTSDMYDSLVESDRYDAPLEPKTARKDNTLNELNDSAVSSMSTDSISIQNSTPEKRNHRLSLNDIFPTHANLVNVRKSSRKAERTLDFLSVSNPPEDFSGGTVLNLSMADLNKTMSQLPVPPPICERQTRKNRNSKSPPDSTTCEPLPMLEEALNLTVTKRKSSSATVKASPPRHCQEPTTKLSMESSIQNLACPISEQPKVYSGLNLMHTSPINTTSANNEVLKLEVLSTSSKQEKKRSKKEIPPPIPQKISEGKPVVQSNVSGNELLLEALKPTKAKGASKSSKKTKTQTNTSAVILTELQSKETAFDSLKGDFENNSKQKIQTASNLPVKDSLVDVPNKVSNINQPITTQFTDDSDKVSPVKSSPETKKGKGRPRKQATVLLGLLTSQAPENLVTKSIESNQTLEASSAITSPKKAGRPSTKDKNSTKQSKTQSKPLGRDQLEKTAESNVINEGKDNKLKADIPDLSKNTTELSSHNTIKEQSTGKFNTTAETVQSISENVVSNEITKKKGRPKKLNKKEPAKGFVPDQENQLESASLKHIVDDGNTNINAMNKEKPSDTPNNNMRILPSGEDVATENVPIMKQKCKATAKPSGEIIELEDKSSISDDVSISHQPQSSEQSVFDNLRSIQENVFFNRQDNKSLTRKYTRKSAATVKKPIPKLLQPNEIPSTSYSANNTHPVAEITLNDGNYLVSSLSEPVNSNGLQSKPCKQNQLSENKSLEVPKKMMNTRRSNRHKSGSQLLSDNSSICKELDEIVASFLNDDESVTSCDKIESGIAGPTRLINIDPSLPNDKRASCTSNNNDTPEVLKNPMLNVEKPLKKTPQNLEKPPESSETHSDQKLICKELSITLTKISEDEIEAQKKLILSKKAEANHEITLQKPSSAPTEIVSAQPPRRTRARRNSVKPENISLTDNANDSKTEFDALFPAESNDFKLTKQMSRKRKNASSTNSMENIHESTTEKSSKTQTCVAPTEDLLIETAQIKPCNKNLDKLERATKTFPTTEKIDKPKLTKAAENQDKPATKQATTRRRRKNELAAIVADQLLESFKEVDKSRIEELKKLENLAYEKSDDLYITGIRLTPLTKRKIAVSEPKEDSNPPKESTRIKIKQKSKSGNASDLAKGSDSEIGTTDSEKPLTKSHTVRGKTKEKVNHENLFRNFTEKQETPKLNIDQISLPTLGSRNFNLTFGTFRSCTPQEFTFGANKNSSVKSNFIPGSAETSCSVDSQMVRLQEESSLKAPTETSNSKSSLQRKMKKKISRLKKEKKAETENINELRTGLESFTFGKNAFQHFEKGLFGSVGFIGLFGSTNRELAVQRSLSSSMPAINTCFADNGSGVEKKDEESKKPFLRPSLLSGIVTQESAANKTSRDPRLNKGKGKSSNKNDTKKQSSHTSKSLEKLSAQDVGDIFVKPRMTSGIRAKKGAKASIQPPKIITIDDNDEDDDDNCLVAIAQSVNNRIMSEEEFSQNDEFEVSLPAETSGHSLPPTPILEPPFLDEQKTSDVPNEDENTNTELIDMDLEDDISVYTSFSQDISGKSRFGQKRRRRRSILLARRPKKVVADLNVQEVSFDCTICNKSFGKAAALAKHQQTFTHVQKLSEYEYLHKVNEPKGKQTEIVASNSKKKPVATELPDKTEGRDKKVEKDGVRKEKAIQITGPSDEDKLSTGELPPGRLSSNLPSLAPTIKPPESVPVKSTVVTADAEFVSSPDRADTTYDRYQNSIRIALSQEERLFYECCNMLKGSETPMVERTYPAVPNTYGTYDVPNKPVTPKSSERFSYLGSEVTGNFQHGTAYTVKSPMSQSRTSPRYAYPKIDINQFSDISSDSNPAFPRIQHPHITLQSGAECHHIGETNATANKVPFYHQTASIEHPHQHGHLYHSEGGAYYTASEEGGRAASLDVSDTARLLTARTYPTEQRGKAVNVAGCTSGYSNVTMDAERSAALSGNEQPLTSPLHSNSSQGSNTNITACRMRTKAAMKGYDNFKVSIPTLGLDLQQALERSPHGGCKLTALAEIALGSEAPITPPRYHQPSSTPSTPNTPVRDDAYDKQPHQPNNKSKPDINEKLAKKYQELIMNNIKPAATKTAKKKEVCDNIGNKSGLRAKRKKANNKANAAAGGASNAIGEDHCDIVEKPPKDIYEFEEESQEPIDKGVGRGSPSKARNSIVIPERPFKNIGSEDKNTIKFHKPDELMTGNEEESQMSTTSYSDRDDFNYGSMSEAGGEESEKEADEQKSSDSDSCASAQTAKTHKCLIVGRIFGNANKNRPIENAEKPAPVVSEPKKKIPSQELNEMFDRLRKDGGKNSEEKRTTNAAKCTAQESQKDEVKASNVAKNVKATKMLEKRKKLTADSKVAATKATPAETGKRENQRSSRSTEGYFPREIAKLQAELGMTAEEIAELIGEGKRKSQRKCAINRPRTVVDTWSSDEYEDFLSTKDVIAFIEEQEKRSKKKRLVGKTESRKDEKNESVAVDLKDSSKENQNESSVSQSTRKNQTGGNQIKDANADKQEKEKTDRVAAKDKKPQRVVDRLLQRFNKSRGNTKKVEPKPPSSTATKQEKMTETTKSHSFGQKTIAPEKSKVVDAVVEPAAESNASSKKQPSLSVKPRLKSRRHTDNDSESDFEHELRRRKSSSGKRTTSKISKRRKTIAFREEHNEMTSDTKYTPKVKQPASQKQEHTVDVAAATSTATGKSADETAPPTGRPLARRKRVASEMLYYWSSSSSDEEFGRIAANEDDVTQKDEYLPKHGWIVGDSHKKLVTLLATAKGKKMTDLKEPVSRKKS